jgi:hypothetical protein
VKVLEADRGDVNVYDVDMSVALNAGSDKVWFTAKRDLNDLDTAAVVRKGMNAPPLSGIAIVDAPTGKVQVVIDVGELNIEDTALLYDVQLKQGTRVTTVEKGTLRLSGQVTQAT